MENMENELREIEEKEIITGEDIDESDPENNENKKYDESRIYYVYEHIRLDKMEPFYIGKGKGERAYELYRNDHHDAITDEYGHAVIIIADHLTEEEAYWLERDTIEDYVFNLGYGIDIKGHNDYDHELPHLTNMDWGGVGGKSGVKQSDETRRKNSESHKGKIPWNKGKEMSEEAKEKMSESHKGKMAGEKHPMWGKTSPNKGKKGLFHHSEESKLKMSESHKGKIPWNKGKEMSEEAKEKMSEKKKGEKHPKAKKVMCITTGKTFNCIKEAATNYNVLYPQYISKCCRRLCESAGELNGKPLKWKYAEDDDNESKAV